VGKLPYRPPKRELSCTPRGGGGNRQEKRLVQGKRGRVFGGQPPFKKQRGGKAVSITTEGRVTRVGEEVRMTPLKEEDSTVPFVGKNSYNWG